MPLKKILFRPGVNRENTRYAVEVISPQATSGFTGGWYESQNVRFRQGTPESIGGWARVSGFNYLGVCRSLWAWTTLNGQVLTGVGTNLKFYCELGGYYYDITPVRGTSTLTNPFATTSGSKVVTVTDSSGGYINGDFVTFSGATAVGGLTLNGQYQITVTTGVSTYTITAATAATSTATGGGTVTATYQINTGLPYEQATTGWGAGGWGTGTWSNSGSTLSKMRLWSQSNFGSDLIFAPVFGPIYYWSTSSSTYLSTPAVGLGTPGLGATDYPLTANWLIVSDTSRFVIIGGTNDTGSETYNPMLVRWSDQESVTSWTPAPTNQAGSYTLSRGTTIMTMVQARQEILVYTDTALYSMQYVGTPAVWGFTLMGSNLSIASPNAVAYASGAAYWMGNGKFYMYDGTVRTLNCDLRKYIFDNINVDQYSQIYAGTNEAFNEVWWFYCSAGATLNDSYVIYNYVDQIWYYGQMPRTAWLNNNILQYPIAAYTTNVNSNNLVNQEYGTDDASGATTVPIDSYITSGEFDIDDGQNYSFVWRLLPDITFAGSTASNPSVTMTLLPMNSSGSGYTNPASVGNVNKGSVTRSAVIPIEQFTSQVNTRVRGRQLVMKVEGNQLGTAWQLGIPRLDLQRDGRKS